jgi:hypothetical protein
MVFTSRDEPSLSPVLGTVYLALGDFAARPSALENAPMRFDGEARMSGWLGWFVALAVAASLSAGSAVGAAQAPAKSVNQANDKLLKASPAERAAALAGAVGHWCIGTETFLMGVETSGPGAGNAYWSLRCAAGEEWAVQIDPLANVDAIDCDTFKTAGAPKECFKKF